MAAQKGRSFLLQIDDGASGFLSLAACRANGMTLNNAEVDITTKSSANWKTLLDDGGVKSMTISASGVFEDSAAEEILRTQSFANALRTYKLLFPNGDTLEGSFLITSYERSGEHADAEMFNAALSLSGAPTFVAA